MDLFDHNSTRFLPGILDLVVIGFYITLMFLSSLIITKKNIDSNPAYKFYTWGIFAKVIGALSICMVYTLYYDGADTTAYFNNSQSLVKLLFREPNNFLRLLVGERSPEVYYWFDNRTGWPWMYRDPESFVVVRFTSIFSLLGLGNFYTTTLLVAWVSYSGIWKLYLLFCELYPNLTKQFAWAILFFPSIVFWASGILKDTFTIMAMGWFTYSFYFLFMRRQKIFANSIIMIISAMVIVLIKPYIIVALTPGAFIWLSFARLQNIKNPVLRATFAPSVVIVFTFVAFLLLRTVSDQLGVYGDLNTIVRKAQITQDDMMRADAYSANYFDIGRLDGTLPNFLSKIPMAINAALFRPYLWEARNPLMILSALENTLFMIMVLVIFWRTGPIKGVKIISKEPLVIFSLLFALIFAFAVGVSNANFGALVRLRVPLIPFFTGALVIMQHISIQYKKEKKSDWSD